MFVRLFTNVEQARDDILPQLPRLCISAKLVFTTVSCWEVDEVGLYLTRRIQVIIHHVPSLNIAIWSIAVCCHAASKSFAGLFVVRLILGMCEGSVNAGFLIVTSMFYTRTEQTQRVGYWCECYLLHLRKSLTCASDKT